MRKVIITYEEEHWLDNEDDTVTIVYPTPFSIPKMVSCAMRMAPDEIIIKMERR